MIYVCSPYRGDIIANIAFAKRCCLEVIKAGKTPFAPHLFFTQFLNDDILEERERGISCGLEVLSLCSEIWVFCDKITEGMRAEIGYAKQYGVEVLYVDNTYFGYGG
jgi:hypothetical protein